MKITDIATVTIAVVFVIEILVGTVLILNIVVKAARKWRARWLTVERRRQG